MTIIESVLEKFRELFYKLLLWRERNIQEKNFILIVALIIGIVTGFVSLLLKFMIEEIAMLATSHLNVTGGNFQYIICPMIGILLAALYVKYIVRYNISHGVTKVLYAISKSNSRLKPHNMYSSVVASSITIGFGGSVGAEGPIVYTGAAIGSNIGRVFRLSPRLLMIMVGCGAAAGIAGIFKAPIAGMLFTIEVLMLDLTAISVMPLLVASISAATVAYAFTGFDVQFFFAQSEMFETARIPLVIALGIFCGLVSIYFTKAINMMENMFKKIEGTYNKFFIGAAILGLLIFIFPPLYGEGYGTINQLLAGDVTAILDGSIFYGYKDSVWMIAIFIGLIILTKVFATSATTGGGGVGGTFA
ncbi:MAG: chloride channel protein, partial [Bacteroidales bacterium]